jgi:serine O-acetyltransferase
MSIIPKLQALICDIIGVNYCSSKFNHVWVPHKTGVVINGMSEIGIGCTIYQGVTIGSIDKLGGQSPIIGDNVTIYANSTLVGPIKIGDNAVIGANCFVNYDVPANMMVKR